MLPALPRTQLGKEEKTARRIVHAESRKEGCEVAMGPLRKAGWKMTFDELVSRCKGAVSLEVNEHRNYYESVKDRLENFDDEIEPALLAGMIEADTYYRLQFYPETPVGFYVVYGLSLEGCLKRAEECFK